MILCEKHYVDEKHDFYEECHQLCFVAKNLYNQTIYQLKQLDAQNIKPKYNRAFMYQLMKNTPEFRTQTHHSYNGLYVPVRPLKSVFQQIQWQYSSFFALIRKYKKDPSSLSGVPRPPKYLPKNGRFVITYDKEALSFKTGKIQLSGSNIFVNSKKATKTNIVEVSIVPLLFGYHLIVKYRQPDQDALPDNGSFMGIDLGVTNLMTCVFNDPKLRPFIINGKSIKQINQYYNKTVAEMKSKLPQGVKTSKKIKKFTQIRNFKIENEMHTATSMIIQKCKEYGIMTIVCGYNAGWKQNVSIGKINNQNFVSIPYCKLINMLKYKCEIAGIKFIVTREAYTSKCSAMDLETICKHQTYIGSRVNRGQFTHTRGIINADCNGALNILRKVAGDSIFTTDKNGKLVVGYAVSPLRFNINWNLTTKI